MHTVRGLIVWFAASIAAASGATLVGVNFGPSGSPSPTNWTLMTAPGTVNNLIDSTGAPTTVSLTVSSMSPPPDTFSGTPGRRNNSQRRADTGQSAVELQQLQWNATEQLAGAILRSDP